MRELRRFIKPQRSHFHTFSRDFEDAEAFLTEVLGSVLIIPRSLYSVIRALSSLWTIMIFPGTRNFVNHH